ncbi:MAG TPA: DUF5305 family protein [Peptococcaceae bacterium]|nr:DUF5305 family protein [Peptococcaceae bacterium]HPZ70842.1 DUF5305 family protein [Peptococcaceae bacterium]HQD54440.1 DUF5305 family protein [Peptococcaceae bacterium]
MKTKEENKDRKMALPKNVRLFLSITLTVVLVVFLVTLVLKVSVPGKVQEEVPRYEYLHKGDLQYQVSLRNNLLYSENILGMGMVYPTAYVEQILAKAVYQYSGDKPGELTGQYRITARVEGVQQEEKTEKVLWSKEYTLVPDSSFQSADGQIQLEKDVTIPFAAYNSFASQVQEDSGIMSSVKLTVAWQINTQVQTEEGLVQEELTPSFTVPLNSRYFEIDGPLSQEKEGALTETVTKTVPVEGAVVAGLLGGALLSLLLLLGVRFFTKAAQSDEYTSLVNRIFKKYEERLVALQEGLSAEETGNAEQWIRVKTMDDLVRVADEISQPVYYSELGLDGEEGYAFYVISDKEIVTYELKPDLAAEASIKEKQDAPVKQDTKELGV